MADLVAALMTASRALIGISARSLAGIEETVTLTQFRSLVVLSAHGPQRLSRLAAILGVNSSTAMRSADRLVEAGFVDRGPNDRDRREVILELSERGQRLVDEVTSKRWEAVERIVRAMPAEDCARMVDALVAFAEAADEPLVVDEASLLAW